jgi:hypothetical protein
MADLEITKRGSGRPLMPKRAEETQAVRRRRVDMGNMAHLRFSIPDHLRDDKRYRYHWFVDRPGRIEQKTKHDDWDLVEEPAIAADSRHTGVGTRNERHAGVDQFGKPLRAFLARKLREYDEADKAADQRRLDDKMKQIKRGKHAAQAGRPQEDDGTYVPEGGIVIQENNTR